MVVEDAAFASGFEGINSDLGSVACRGLWHVLSEFFAVFPSSETMILTSAFLHFDARRCSSASVLCVQIRFYNLLVFSVSGQS